MMRVTAYFVWHILLAFSALLAIGAAVERWVGGEAGAGGSQCKYRWLGYKPRLEVVSKCWLFG